MGFGVSMSSFYGTEGEFRIESQHGSVVASYVQTRIRAAADGNWDSLLTQYMKPWREVFSVEKMSFDELLQRDLDDARVADELIPYLMGTESSKYPVFPPILAVLTPKTMASDSIERFYPEPTIISPSHRKYGDVFEVSNFLVDGEPSPIGEIRYNPHRCAFVIVDGQHRAMALLALFRQLQGSSAWGSNPYATFYSHLNPKPSQVAHIQLPVCVLYFPELFEGSEEVQRVDSDLLSVCRQIFLDVNKQAKKVSRARELLLDDTHFPAILMRRALTSLKGHKESSEEARIYAFDYGRDEASDSDRVVVVNATEYCSSHALHVLMGSLCFANPETLPINSSSDVTDGRRRRNSLRPAALLRGIPLSSKNTRTISTHHASLVGREERELIVSSLFDLWEPVVPGMFNKLRPYRIHNRVLQELQKELLSPAARANASLNEARSLIFDGGAGRAVFFRHSRRLKKYLEEKEFSEFRSEEVVTANLKHCSAVTTALQEQEKLFKERRAFAFWNIKPEAFANDTDGYKAIVRKGDSLFDAFRTQALQLGYAMACASVINYMLFPDGEGTEAEYEEIKQVVQFVAKLLSSTVNKYFSPVDDTERRSITQGYFSDSRSDVFTPGAMGLRGLFSTPRGKDLNERAWVFFRYSFIEILFCRFTREAHKEVLESTSDEVRDLYCEVLPSILSALGENRLFWVEKFVESGLKRNEFKAEKSQKELELKVDKKTDAEIQAELAAIEQEETKRMDKLARDHLRSSIGHLDSPEKIIEELATGKNQPTSAEELGQEESAQSVSMVGTVFG